jgi:signal transduction histidine kinase
VLGEWVEGWVRRKQPLIDTATAGLLTGLCLGIGVAVQAEAEYFVFTVLLAVPLMLRRRLPVVCAAVVLAAALLQWLTVRHTVAMVPADLAVPIAVYSVTAYGSLWASRVGVSAGLIGAVLGGITWPRLITSASSHVLLGALMASTVVAAWAFGTLHQVRRRQVATLAERARLLELEREQRDRLAELRERTRIAREMHDVVAHSLAVLIAQADGGRYAKDPTAANAALETIGDHARQALGETRRILGVLREGPSLEPEQPQPGVGEIAALVAQVRSSGIDVRLTMDSPPLEPGLGLVLYRIVQEGLTNVIKHAGTRCRVEVSVRKQADQVEVEVVDDGHKKDSATGGPGLGLVGMRERVAAYGGSVVAAPLPDGGFRVSARIPL